MIVFVVGRSPRERSALEKSSLVSNPIIMRHYPEENIDDLLDWQRQRPKSKRYPPISPREASFSYMEGNRSELDDQNLKYRRCDQDPTEKGIPVNASKHID
jgi:hypothetical protein